MTKNATLFIITISIAMSFGIYGVVVQRGANLVRLGARALLMALLWGAWELAAALAGYGIGDWILIQETARGRSAFWVHVAAGAILVCIGLRMLARALRSRAFHERRMEGVDIRADLLLCLRLCGYGLFAGISCGLLRLRLPLVLFSSFSLAAAFAVAGYVTGRAWGAAPSTGAYAIGGGLLCAAGIALQILPLA